MAERENVFRFLDLPAELCNRVYTDASTKTGSDECCVLPCLSLAHINRQLRAEYLPICLKAPVTIAMTDVQNYLDTFYPTVDDKLKNVEQAPYSVTIIANKSITPKDRNDFASIDFLPLIKMRYAHATFQCHFVHVSPALIPDPELRADYDADICLDCLKADNEVLRKLMDHANIRWVQGILTGKVHAIFINRIGRPFWKTAEVFLRTAEADGQPVKEGAIPFEGDEQAQRRYLEAVGLAQRRFWAKTVRGTLCAAHGTYCDMRPFIVWDDTPMASEWGA